MVWVFAEIAIVLAIVGFVIWWITRPPARGDRGDEKGESKPGNDPEGGDGRA